MNFSIRLGRPDDADQLIGFDHVARSDDQRAGLIRGKLDEGACWVAESGARLFGYAVQGTFFDYDFLDLVYVDETSREQGVGSALIDAVERARRTPKVFTSTNESNTTMQAMLARLGYKPSGTVYNLDPGDPELLFVKEFAPAISPDSAP
jgi:GNAT superfamily N-acetyltransferase